MGANNSFLNKKLANKKNEKKEPYKKIMSPFLINHQENIEFENVMY